MSTQHSTAHRAPKSGGCHLCCESRPAKLNPLLQFKATQWLNGACWLYLPPAAAAAAAVVTAMMCCHLLPFLNHSLSHQSLLNTSCLLWVTATCCCCTEGAKTLPRTKPSQSPLNPAGRVPKPWSTINPASTAASCTSTSRMSERGGNSRPWRSCCGVAMAASDSAALRNTV